MKFKNPIPKEVRENIKDLLVLKKALITKGIITDEDVKKEKEK